MISSFPISENDNPNLALFKKLKENGTFDKIKQNIQCNFKEQQNIPQNAFTRANLKKILKKTQNFKRNYLDPSAFKTVGNNSIDPKIYKTIGKINYMSDSKLVYKMHYQESDKKLEKNQPKIITKLIKKNKILRRLPKFKIFFEKLYFWLKNNKDCPKIDAKDSVTLLKSLQNNTSIHNKIGIDDPLFKNEENEESLSQQEEEPHFSGIVYPKLENIIDFFEIPPVNKNVIVKKSFNLLAKENSLFDLHLDDPIACTFWKLKDIKKFFILFFKYSKNFEMISKNLNKNELECRMLYRITKEFFDLKGSYKDIKRNKTKDTSKEIIQEVKKKYFLTKIFSDI